MLLMTTSTTPISSTKPVTAPNAIQFTFSDTIAGYVTGTNWSKRTFSLKTSDEREFQIRLTETTYGEYLRNLGEQFYGPDAPLDQIITPGRYLFVYGLFYPEGGSYAFEAKRIIFAERRPEEYRFEAPDWWTQQIRALAEFYLTSQFPDGNIDMRQYRTFLTLEGKKIESTRQETDTISRMVYGFATAYLLTGEDKYLEVAERGTEYLREHMRAIDNDQDIVYWYHASEQQSGGGERKIYASQFGDDINAIPAYEQIYALAGPIQTYRITGDPRILRDAEMTINLFDKYFLDRDKGGYFAHIDPVSFNPRAESLGINRARKNWNSVGDHAPAYLINLWLATGEQRYADFLVSTADTIAEHFPDFDHSPFVQERFYEDWSHDTSWAWQQNRGVTGHNLKIAWNLMRIHHLRPNERYTEVAKRIAELMPEFGMDRQRGGWYDVIERAANPGEDWHRFVWHDRKAWWQQEQGILAYLILHGSLRTPDYLRLARESVAFYNAFFLDHDSGGVYFNVLASGEPYVLGNERFKGNHSMSCYHAFELCYLAEVYTNLLIRKQPMNFYFKPGPGAFKDNILRVQPDILPPGSVRLESVWINGDPYHDFDPQAMTIKLPSQEIQETLVVRPFAGNPYRGPAGRRELKVRARIAPTGLLFDTMIDIIGTVAQVTLTGDLNDVALPAFKAQLDRVVSAQPGQLVLRLENLQSMSPQAARQLTVVTDQLALTGPIVVVGTNENVRTTLQNVGLWDELKAMETFDPSLVRGGQ
jgi:anti-anti-sigma factor